MRAFAVRHGLVNGVEPVDDYRAWTLGVAGLFAQTRTSQAQSR